MRPLQLNAQRGFTLVELAIVIWIVGILAAVALPAYQDYTGRARVSEAIALAGALRESVSEYYDRWGTLPPDNAAAGLAPPEQYRGKVVRGITITDGLIRVQVEVPTASAEGAHATSIGFLYLVPTEPADYQTGILSWTCTNKYDAAASDEKGLDPNLLPGNCR